MQLLLDKNPLEAGKLLYALVAKDMLLSTNKGRWTTYAINKEYTQGVENSRSKRQGVKRQGVEKARSNKKEKIIERIIAFCQEPHTLQEIAQELGFSDRYKMKRKYINPLLGDVLQMTSVESKNAPTQKYVVISKSL
ncbi:Fic family protein [Capnocytophaga gingivalis]